MSHYSLAFRPAILNKWADAAATQVIAQSWTKLPVFIYSGMSGIVTATAVSLAIARLSSSFPYAMMYVRKPGEESHGNKIEYEHINSQQHYTSPFDTTPVFVDDFIATGDTLLRCLAAYQQDAFTTVEISSIFVLLSGSYGNGPGLETLDTTCDRTRPLRLTNLYARLNSELRRNQVSAAHTPSPAG